MCLNFSILDFRDWLFSVPLKTHRKGSIFGGKLNACLGIKIFFLRVSF